jgi:hypothetical protein
MKAIKFLTVGLFMLALIACPVFAESCCDKAKSEGKECIRKCCSEARKAGKVCEKCNPKSEKQEGQDKK